MDYLPDRLRILGINQVYNDLSRYTLADDAIKQAHIDVLRWRN